VAPDGSGYAITATFNTGGAVTYTLRDIAGDSIVSGTSITDPNNNKIYTTDGLNYYDTLGQLALSVTTAGSNPMVYTYTGGNGPATVKVNYSPVSVSTHFGVSGVSEYSGTPNLVSSILLPDNSSYVFHYDGYGRVSELDLPTGGYAQYQYSTGALVHTVSDRNTTSTWQYTQS
jgi:hypothetical protein